MIVTLVLLCYVHTYVRMCVCVYLSLFLCLYLHGLCIVLLPYVSCFMFVCVYLHSLELNRKSVLSEVPLTWKSLHRLFLENSCLFFDTGKVRPSPNIESVPGAPRHGNPGVSQNNPRFFGGPVLSLHFHVNEKTSVKTHVLTDESIQHRT